MSTVFVDNKLVGQRLRTLRGEKTLETVSKDTGVNRSSLNMYELGERTPRDGVKIVLAEYYGVSVEELFFAR